MFDFCGEVDASLEGSYSFTCYFTYYWVLAILALLFLTILGAISYIFWKSSNSKDGFFKIFGNLINSPVHSSFCHQLTRSKLINKICFYSLIFAATFAAPLIHISYSLGLMNGNLSNDVIYRRDVLAAFFRIIYLFTIFIAMEVIYLRSYYIKKNKKNLLSSAVDVSERRVLARFIFKKALIISSILFLAELIPITIYFDHLYEEPKLYNITRFMESVLVLFMGIPKLKLLTYEKLLVEESKYISMRTHSDALITKHLEEIQIKRRNVPNFIEDLNERAWFGCSECGQQRKICSHLIKESIENRMELLRNKLEEEQKIANENLAAMLPTNARNTVGCLKVVLVMILVDFAINSISFGLMVMCSNLVESNNQLIVLARLVCRTLKFFDTPIFIWVVLDVRKAFGEFHSVLERSELKEQMLDNEMNVSMTLLEHTLEYSTFENQTNENIFLTN